MQPACAYVDQRVETEATSFAAYSLPRFDTVGSVPQMHFDENRSFYGLTERVLDGDTIRVRHVPGFAFTNDVPEPLQKRSLVNDTLLIRLYGSEFPTSVPELTKKHVLHLLSRVSVFRKKSMPPRLQKRRIRCRNRSVWTPNNLLPTLPTTKW